MLGRTIELRHADSPSKNGVFQVVKEFVVPKIVRKADETKSVLFLADGRSLYARKVQDFCTPELFGFETADLSPAGIYCLAWVTLRNRGFLVVQDVWKASDDVVVTTNLTTDGKTSVYDRKMDKSEGAYFRDPEPMDGKFVQIDLKEVAKEGEKLVKLAQKTGVGLMPDGSFHLVVSPDGTWREFVLDIGKVKIYHQPKDMPGDVRRNNIAYMRTDMIEFGIVQNNILARRKALGLL